ncbi:MAG: arginine--tRNA ligase [Clostridia bacterium]|nr:arginine--tRNA ligase [Clostridia bacterium]
MNFKKILAQKIKVDGVSTEDIENMLSTPPSVEMGDYALPCFGFAKIQRCSPMQVAENIAGSLSQDELISQVKVVNGYLNIYLDRARATEAIVSELLAKEDIAKSDIGKGKRVCIDFSSVNVAKAPHIGHFSNTVIGASISRIYEKMGYEVIKLNYLGDYGTQFGKLVCAYLKWGNRADVEARGIDALQELYIRVNEECDKDEALLNECRETFKKLENKDPQVLELFEWFKQLSINEVKKTLFEPLGITFDDWRGEQHYAQYTDRVLGELESSGVAKISQGALAVDLEDYNLGVALVRQSNGTTLYLTRDISTALDRKREYDFDKCIYIVGVEQKLHFAQLFKILELMGNAWAKDLLHLVNGRLRLPEGRLSSRKGNQALAKDIMATSIQKAEEVMRERGVAVDKDRAKDIGLGALVFSALKTDISKDSVFVLEDAINFDGETGPYLMYTHARCASILRKANIVDTDIDCTIQPDNTWEVVTAINKYSMVVANACTENEPSILARYLLELASVFNKFYHDNRIITEQDEVTKKNVAITSLVARVIKQGLAILGINAPDEM